MSTPITAPASGFFAQLMPMLTDRTLMVIVSKTDDHHLTLSVVPKRIKDGENAALTTPLCCTGTPEELDREVPAQLRDFVAGHVALANNLAQIQREREEAEKAAREELKKKQKTVGNGGVKAKTPEPQPKPEEKVSSAAPTLSTMSLFESTGESGPHVETTSLSEGTPNSVGTTSTSDNNNNAGGAR